MKRIIIIFSGLCQLHRFRTYVKNNVQRFKAFRGVVQSHFQVKLMKNLLLVSSHVLAGFYGYLCLFLLSVSRLFRFFLFGEMLCTCCCY